MSSSIDDIDDHVLGQFYDAGSLARGIGYADEDRVRVIEESPGSIDAVCRGSGRSSYLVRIRWRQRHGLVELDDGCSCPLGGACKHCVATLLTVRRTAHDAWSAEGLPLDPGSNTERRVLLPWRSALSELVGVDADDAQVVDLALQVGIHRSRPTHYAPDPVPELTIRPMRMGRTGRWVKTGANWRDVSSPYASAMAGVDPPQRAAVQAIAASGRVDAYTYTSQAIPLARFGPELWLLLRRAVEAGVALVDQSGDELIDLVAECARPHVDLVADDASGVTITARLMLDGAELVLEPDSAGPLGTPPHGVWCIEHPRIRLVSFERPLHPAVMRLLEAGSVTVPARDVDELLDTYAPALARHAGVGSSDGSVTITTSRFDGLVLHIDRTAIDEARVQWKARYRRGERTTDHPLDRSGRRHRDHLAEAAAIGALKLPTHLFEGLADHAGAPVDVVVSGSEVIALLGEVVPWLEAAGEVAIEVSGDVPLLREAVDDPLVSLTVADGERGGRADPEGTDWFDLHVEVSVDGETIDFPSLFTALDRGHETIILPSGTWMKLDRPELTRLRELIEEARGLAEPRGAGVARVNRFQASWWEELAALGVVGEQSQRWADSVEQMASLSAPEPLAPPVGLEATLRPYQQEGFEWLAFLHRNGLGGILADDMGLGKTVQTLALCLHVHDQDPDARFLVVAPTSVVENWAHEAQRFAPDLGVRTIRETAKRRGSSLDEAIDGAQLVVTSYALFRLEFDDYAHHGWELLLLDEAQFVKNHRGKTYQCVRRLDAATKVAITGTPIENTLMDLWSLLSITAPGLYPDPGRFSETYRRPIENGSAPELLGTLRRRIAPLMRRRTKEVVLSELPPKTEQTVEVEMSARHARIYATQLQRQRQKILGLVDDVDKNRFEILKSLTVLRQMALDPGLVDDEHDGVGSAKLDRLLEDLDLIVAEGHRALVFSQFTRYLSRVRVRLDDAGIDYSYLDGRTRRRDRAIARFKDGDAPVFVISLKAGGVGLNLTEADYCFVLDPWWNPATETQAVDRAHRIGQQNPVMVYRYVSVGTIEEKVMELKARKADLFASVMDADGALSGALSGDDIRGLLDLP
jgi:superfamily II DNA or RNA helicase